MSDLPEVKVGPEMARALEVLARTNAIDPKRACSRHWMRRHNFQTSVFTRLEAHGLVAIDWKRHEGFHPEVVNVALTDKGRALVAVWALRKDENRAVVFGTVTGRTSSAHPNIQDIGRSK